jgi:hypothetical protein
MSFVQHPLDEVEEVPPRSSSIRNWSLTSATPTTSSASSHTLPRSHHTANTSVDLNISHNSLRPSSHGSTTSGFRHSLYTAPETRQNLVKLASPGFNIDDYLSSDDDDFTEPRRPRGEGEEHLLFNDTGYGIDGALLPGLIDAAPAPEIRLHNPRHSMSYPTQSLRQAYSSPYLGAAALRRRKYILDTAFDVDSSEDGYSSDEGDDWLLSTVPLAPNQRQASRLSAQSKLHSGHARFGSHVGDAVIEEERFEKVDITTAIRLRKEAKAQKRALALVQSRYNLHKRNKGKALAHNSEPDDEGCAADVE